jgi:uncharacterized RmlC-like cupin family protein
MQFVQEVIMTTEWRHHGVRIVSSSKLDPNTPQTPGMTRAAAINRAPHHHGELESIIYIISGRARMRWGERLEFVAEAGPGDFIFVPPFVPHQEINANANEPLACVVVRSDQEPVVVNLDIPAIESPEEISWDDSLHNRF